MALGACLFAVIGWIIPIGLNFMYTQGMTAYLKTKDYDYFFQYHTVFTDEVHRVGEELLFKSDAEFFRAADITWEDTLYCDLMDEGKYTFYSQYISQKKNQQPEPRKTEEELEESGGWAYQGKVPQRETSCYLLSSINAFLPEYNLSYQQVHQGDPFNITP